MADYISGEIRGFIEIPNGVDVRIAFVEIENGYRMIVSNAGVTQFIDLHGFDENQIEQINQTLSSAITAIETAQGKAEDAQEAAETAQGKAEDAQEAAETAKGKAEDAQAAAETAQGKAEDAQEAAETAKGKAEDAQEAAETAQGKAEDAQEAAETAQDKAETEARKAADAAEVAVLYGIAITSTDNTLIFSSNE